MAVPCAGELTTSVGLLLLRSVFLILYSIFVRAHESA